MNADIRLVDKLRNRHVTGNARELIRLMLRQPRCIHEKVNHFLDRQRRRPGEVRIRSHRDEVRRRFRPRPG